MVLITLFELNVSVNVQEFSCSVVFVKLMLKSLLAVNLLLILPTLFSYTALKLMCKILLCNYQYCPSLFYDLIILYNILFNYGIIFFSDVQVLLFIQSIYTRAGPGIIMGGVLPFGCIFIQLFFILNSIWYVLHFKI